MELYLIETVTSIKCLCSLGMCLGWVASIGWAIIAYLNCYDMDDYAEQAKPLCILVIVSIAFTILCIFIPSGDAMREMLK